VEDLRTGPVVAGSFDPRSLSGRQSTDEPGLGVSASVLAHQRRQLAPHMIYLELERRLRVGAELQILRVSSDRAYRVSG
jgi:hypothetical protein